jgi:hypothetical protein
MRTPVSAPVISAKAALPVNKIKAVAKPAKQFIGGPSQPEMTSFKSVGTDNMVNLFTGDFNYNIPLLDVGGYPVNLFYDGGITMEQEASWVGLGWNINPGTVSRNMRGVPDDFNGDDTLTDTQMMKPNKTWGVNLNGDVELVGIKDVLGFSIGGSVGISYNNYLGPALDLGIKGGTNFTIAGKAGSEKTALKMGAGLGVNVGSRSGLTLSPNMSLTASSFANVQGLSTGLSLGTSYNSRTGIKQLQLSEQMSYNYNTSKKIEDPKTHKDRYVNGSGSRGASLYGTSISFSKPSYMPAIRMPLNNESYAGHFQLGGAIFGLYASAEVEAYSQKSSVAFPVQKKPLVGYLYYEKARNNANAVMDFSRVNDHEVTANTPIIAAAQYAYDVFSIQGEGTGGTIRAYRNDMGYVRDNVTRSGDKSLSIGADIGIPGHYGANFNTIKTPTVISEWGYGNRLASAIGFKERVDSFENVYFRNPGETSVLLSNQWDRIGGTDLVRFKLGGTNAAPTVETKLERFSKANSFTGTVDVTAVQDSRQRKKRTQVVSFLTAQEATAVGLDALIKSYNTASPLDANNALQYTSLPRMDANRKKHHLSEIDVTQPDGRRYVYGLPVYNIKQKDFSFTVSGTGTDDDKVNISATEPYKLNDSITKDGYYQITETPGYAHSFLLTGLLSADYVDVTGNGITEDDLGDAVKFNYSKMADHVWRTPHTGGTTGTANFNAGNRTERKDDKGMISWGQRESWYVHSIESKSMIALFTLEDRTDGKGALTEYAGVNTSDNSEKRLKKIDLYNKADLKKNGLAKAKPVKTVWFAYSYSLCTGTPDNASGSGKLTLDSVYFTYNDKARSNNNKYVFAYTNTASDNPSYAFNAADRWGNYKLKGQNPGSMKNGDFPYALQNKTVSDQNANAWSLKKVLLPSGGQIEVTYESDDYAFVQDRRAADMMEIAGLGKDATTITNKLYQFNVLTGGMSVVDHDYVFIKVPEPCANKAEVFQKYLLGQQQLAFKLAVNMPNGVEYVPSYATIADYGVFDQTRIWVRLNKVNNVSPLSLTALEYLRERLPGQAFPGYDVSDGNNLQKIGEMLLGMLDALKSAYRDPVQYLRTQGKAQTIVATNSFVRLNDPDGFKYGGGQRVKTIKLKDNWKAMTNQYTSEYGQTYDYTTKEVFIGKERTISSGVASYEPSIGGEENPFQTIVQVVDKLPLGPATYGAIEMPVLDAFFPAPLVGYSKVTVRSLNKNTDTTKTRSGIGRQVTEFYTAKDFPVYYNHTAIDPNSNKEEHQASLLSFFYKYAFDSRALSQGFIVETNDMHGKLKSQSSYAENDSTSRMNYTENFYRNTGNKGLNDKFDFVYAAKGGVVEEGNMGIDVELMTDTREFSVKSTSFEVQAQLDLFPVIFPFWLPFIWPVSGESENTYRAVTTTKAISYHSILDSTVVIDKGSQIATKNLAYDAETGETLITRTNNEFDKPVYTVKYPAWWAYSGMGLAYKNIDVTDTASFRDGKMITNNALEKALIESGDELYIIKSVSGTPGCMAASPDSIKKIWAFDKNKSTTALTVPVKDLVYVDENGKLFTKNTASFRIIRSGKRNMLQPSLAGVTLMANPIVTTSNVRKVTINSSSNVLTASAVEYQEKWSIDNDVIRKLKQVTDPATCVVTEVEDCAGYLEKSINPYRKGLLGNFKPNRNMVYYGDRAETNPAVATNLPLNGFLSGFTPYWNFNTSNNLVPDNTNTKWVWNEQSLRFNAKGMQLETKNALNIYTAAQYGYHKTLPVAITDNSSYSEMMYDGFEDYGYAEALNNMTVNACAQKHIDLAGLANSQIVNSDTTAFAAHTGKYMLSVNKGTTMAKKFAIGTGTPDSYSFSYVKDTVQRLDVTGGNVQLGQVSPGFAGQSNQDAYLLQQTTFQSGGVQTVVSMGNTMTINGTSSRNFAHNVQFEVSYYIDVSQYGSYQFTVGVNGNGYGLPVDDFSGAYVEVKDVNGNSEFTQSYANSAALSKIFNVSLCKGIHFIRVNFNNSFNYTTTQPTTTVSTSYIFSLTTNAAGINYKNLSKANSCIYTKPAAATDSMLNPVFSIPANKKMIVSTWVREQCTTCVETGYANNLIQLQYNTGKSDTLLPAGPVIEGWQRYEGAFTPPAGATQMTMNLVNKSSSPIYFDDIRIHPFNAIMKSYVYDPVTLRLVADLDANNYASFYEYDEEGGLIRSKVETREGVKTIKETRSFHQRSIKQVQ